jgi:Ca2+-binding RTX toxin-like protein
MLKFGKIAVVVIPVLLMLLLAPSANAQSCLGKKAKVVRQSSGVYQMKRFETSFFTGKRLLVKAKGDNRVCSSNGEITVLFGKANRNYADLGYGKNKVVFQQKANSNFVRSKGTTQVFFRAKANQNKYIGGSGNDYVLVGNKSVSTSIDGGDGNNRIDLAGRSNNYIVKTGSGNDLILARDSASALKRTISSGFGDDRVTIIGRGNTTAYLSPKQGSSQITDNDVYRGNSSNDTVFDYLGGEVGNPNLIYGGNGADKLYSIGSAYSFVYGGNGSDWLYAASSETGQTRLIGERGNDRGFANRGSSTGEGVYLDGGPGDNRNYGSNGNDVILSMTGLSRNYGGAGDDLILMTGSGLGEADGGAGNDTISFAGHTPPGFAEYSGIDIDLQAGESSKATGSYALSEFERVIGSSFDDRIRTKTGVNIEVEAGLGNDIITAYNGDNVNGGLGDNDCSGGSQVNCNEYSPGPHDPNKVAASINEDGFLSVYGSENNDQISVSYSLEDKAYKINSQTAIENDGLCRVDSYNQQASICPADFNVLTGIVVAGEDGNDQITVDYSVPTGVSTILNGNEGNNIVYGGVGQDFIFSSGDGYNQLYGRDGVDQVSLTTPGKSSGGGGSDLMNINNPCLGIQVSGGSGKDNLVMAGAQQAVQASLASGSARWRNNPCASPLRINQDFEDIEGSRFSDILEGNRKRSTGFLGREGRDTFLSKNGIKDSIITGPGAGNRIIGDRFDKITYGWGLADF